MTVAVSLRHGSAAVLTDVAFKRVLDRGRIICERVLQRIDKHVRLISIHIAVICGGVSVVGCQSKCGEELVCGVVVLNTVEYLRVARVVVHISVSADVRNFEIAELNSLDGVAIGFAVAGELVHYLRVVEDGLDSGFIPGAR